MFKVLIFLRYSLILTSVLCSVQANSKNLHQKTKSKPISALILFFGDYKAEVQFDGSIQEKITGLLNETKDFKADSDCELAATFQEVLYLNSRHLKIQFFAICEVLDSDQKTKIKESITLQPEFVRLKDLKTESSGFYLSKTHKNVQFKIKDLKY